DLTRPLPEPAKPARDAGRAGLIRIRLVRLGRVPERPDLQRWRVEHRFLVLAEPRRDVDARLPALDDAEFDSGGPVADRERPERRLRRAARRLARRLARGCRRPV